MDMPDTYKISVVEARAWKLEAKLLGRSEDHLKKIDQVLLKAKIQQRNLGNTEVVEISNRDYFAMQHDRKSFAAIHPPTQVRPLHNKEEALKLFAQAGSINYATTLSGEIRY